MVAIGSLVLTEEEVGKLSEAEFRSAIRIDGVVHQAKWESFSDQTKELFLAEHSRRINSAFGYFTNQGIEMQRLINERAAAAAITTTASIFPNSSNVGKAADRMWRAINEFDGVDITMQKYTGFKEAMTDIFSYCLRNNYSDWDEQKLTMLKPKLVKSADIWYRTLRETKKMTERDFWDAFKEKYYPQEVINSIRNQARNHRQKKGQSVRKFSAAFDLLILQLPEDTIEEGAMI